MGTYRSVQSVEREFGYSFEQVIHEFAADGESLEATAGIIGFSGTRLRTLLKKLGLEINWPKPTDSNGWRGANRNYGTGNHLRAAQENICKAWPVNAARFEATRKTTPEIMKRAIALHNQGYGWRKIPKMLELNINHTSLLKCYNKDYKKGPLK